MTGSDRSKDLSTQHAADLGESWSELFWEGECQVITQTSGCFAQFGYEDFDMDRVVAHPKVCPIKGCTEPLTTVSNHNLEMPYCPQHGLRLHANTYVYWNGEQCKDEARLRNFFIRPDLARQIALSSVDKAENYRLGYEMSEDSLTWNVFVGLAAAGKLRETVRFLTGCSVLEEPRLYLWGCLVSLDGKKGEVFPKLKEAWEKFERGIHQFRTEPDVMLVIGGKLVVCIEAKFGSGNTLAHAGEVASGQKPNDREGILRRYLDPAEPRTKKAIDRSRIGPRFHSQLFRNVIFASDMAKGCDWHVVNLVSATQWKAGREKQQPAFLNAEHSVRDYLTSPYHECFTFRTWEALYGDLVQGDDDLQGLADYFRSKSAHFAPAFYLH